MCYGRNEMTNIADNIFKFIFINENVCIWFKLLNIVLTGPLEKMSPVGSDFGSLPNKLLI